MRRRRSQPLQTQPEPTMVWTISGQSDYPVWWSYGTSADRALARHIGLGDDVPVIRPRQQIIWCDRPHVVHYVVVDGDQPRRWYICTETGDPADVQMGESYVPQSTDTMLVITVRLWTPRS